MGSSCGNAEHMTIEENSQSQASHQANRKEMQQVILKLKRKSPRVN